jgi:ribosomal protein S27AE
MGLSPCNYFGRLVTILKNVLPLRYKSAYSPLRPVRNSTLFYYRPGITLKAIATAVGTTETALCGMSPACAASLYVIISNGIRATEYLSATIDQVLPDDRLLCFGLKGSGSYVLNLPGISSQVALVKALLPGIGVSGISYHQLYRACVRCGFYLFVTGHKNLARLHAGRYNLAGTVLRFGEQVASDVLHHRSGRSLHFYTGEKGGNHG